ncbi:MAG: flagellar type III secretion system pore protein FliP [Calditrichae bacterium]|nr:flagellar type III secretion system pore protein FliP [Calditrichota bacterium]MCB9059254.1 flagellar type III secretion system pore protein FliP [Calditrichia bacterium]
MKKSYIIVIILALVALTHIQPVMAQNPLPNLTIGVQQSSNPDDLVPTLQILLLLTVLSLAPSIIIMMTSFTRIIVVFHFLRQSLNTQTVPSNQILVGMALFITFFVMRPVIDEINDSALQPYLDKQITQSEALDKAAKPLRAFMLKQTREQDLMLFVDLRNNQERPKTVDDIPLTTLIPAFIISELKTAFQIGFLLYLPMLLIDLVVGSVLLSMGMMMLPPVMIAMPFKLLLFVLVDGWYLVVESLVKGF